MDFYFIRGIRRCKGKSGGFSGIFGDSGVFAQKTARVEIARAVFFIR